MRAGDSIRITNLSTEDFLISKIDSIKQTDTHIRFAIDNLSHIGGIKDGNFCEIEFYNFSLAPGEPDLDAYVKKTGDTMTGKLEINSDVSAGLIVKGGDTTSNSAFYVQDSLGQTQFRVRNNGQVQAGTSESSAFIAEDDHDLITKKYLDQMAVTVNRPPGRPFRFSTMGLGGGGFNYTISGGEHRMTLNKTDAEGVVWMYDSPGQDTNTGKYNNTAFTIRYWQPGSTTWKMRFTGFINRIDWHSNDAYFWIAAGYSKEGLAKLANNTVYYITIGGIL